MQRNPDAGPAARPDPGPLPGGGAVAAAPVGWLDAAATRALTVVCAAVGTGQRLAGRSADTWAAVRAGRAARVPVVPAAGASAGRPAAAGTDLPGEPLPLRAADGVALRAVHLAPGPTAAPGVAVVLGHGFTGSLDHPGVRALAVGFAAHAGVVALDARGHGGSGGLSTLGDREVLDADAAVGAARALGYRQVVSVGFSMSAATFLRHAALSSARSAVAAARAGRDPAAAHHAAADTPAADTAAADTATADPFIADPTAVWPQHPVDAVVAVSGAAHWYYRGTPAMRRLHWVVLQPAGRWLAARLLRTRIDDTGWDPEPLDPAGAAAALTVPLLIVHGDADHYFPLDHARVLHAAAPGSQLWVWPGFGHAEAAMTGPRVDDIGRALPALLAGPAAGAGAPGSAHPPARHPAGPPAGASMPR